MNLPKALSEAGRALLDLLIPPRCHICHVPVYEAENLHICKECYTKLPFITSAVCTVCGIPFAGAGGDHPCGSCIKEPPSYSAARAALRYDLACRDLIHAYKYSGKYSLRRPLGLLTADALADFASNSRAELLLPVPLHKKRLRERGFNQALLIAEVLSLQWNIPLLRQGLARTRWTQPQIELDRKERLNNLKGAFTVTDTTAISGRRVMLVDDVFTTGSTLVECSKTIKHAGAAEIFAVTIAHAP